MSSLRSLIGWIVLSGLAAPSVAYADWGRIVEPGGGEVVQAGDTVTVRWDRLPEGVDEFELLLSLDDGRSFPIRLTEQLDPGELGIQWQVPNLESLRARLRLRAGVDGHETEGPAGPAFSIRSRDDRPETGLGRWAGELWPVARAPTVEAPDPLIRPRWTPPDEASHHAVDGVPASSRTPVSPPSRLPRILTLAGLVRPPKWSADLDLRPPVVPPLRR